MSKLVPEVPADKRYEHFSCQWSVNKETYHYINDIVSV